MTINDHTKIAAILKQCPAALDAIVSLSPRFEKLRNPVLRKLMAGRTSLAMASKIGGCTVQEFFTILESLGFTVEPVSSLLVHNENSIPGLSKQLNTSDIIELDVRPVLEKNDDPLKLIMEYTRALKPGQVLKIINSFEPAPLMNLLKKQGFESFTEKLHDNLVFTYFYRDIKLPVTSQSAGKAISDDWDQLMLKYSGNMETIDVRKMEMPLPMHAILEALDHLPAGKALFVNHKRIPVFLLPELTDREMDYRIKEIADGNVHLLIFKNSYDVQR